MRFPKFAAATVVMLVGAPIAPAQPIIYASNLGALVRRVPPGGSGVTTYGTGLNVSRGMDFDASGNLYVADSGSNTISVIPPGGGSAQPFGSSDFSVGRLGVQKHSQ